MKTIKHPLGIEPIPPACKPFRPSVPTFLPDPLSSACFPFFLKSDSCTAMIPWFFMKRTRLNYITLHFLVHAETSGVLQLKAAGAMLFPQRGPQLKMGKQLHPQSTYLFLHALIPKTGQSVQRRQHTKGQVCVTVLYVCMHMLPSTQQDPICEEHC